MAGEAMEDSRGISGSTLKITAMIFMLLDHTAAIVLGSVLIKNGVFTANDISAGYIGSLMREGMIGWVYLLYQVMRKFFGRLAFPMYCFLLVEGFEKTHNRKKYAGRLLLFALVSEIPFDLAFSFRVFNFSYQNVFFTLLLGFVMMWVIDTLEKHCSVAELRLAGYGAAVFAAAFTAEKIGCDYRAKGIIAIALLFFFRKNKWEQIIAGCVAFLWEITAPLAFIFIGFYNGRRGIKLKYIFYFFYPVHLFFLYRLAIYFYQ